MTHAMKQCSVQHDAMFPTHEPLIIEVECNKLRYATRQLQKVTDFAELFEKKVQGDTDSAQEAENKAR